MPPDLSRLEPDSRSRRREQARRSSQIAGGPAQSNARRIVDISQRFVTGRTRSYVATLEERDRGRPRRERARLDGHTSASRPIRDRARWGAACPRRARAPSRREETNRSGLLTPENGKNYGGAQVPQMLCLRSDAVHCRHILSLRL